jgi:hypothetical protein
MEQSKYTQKQPTDLSQSRKGNSMGKRIVFLTNSTGTIGELHAKKNESQKLLSTQEAKAEESQV